MDGIYGQEMNERKIVKDFRLEWVVVAVKEKLGNLFCVECFYGHTAREENENLRDEKRKRRKNEAFDALKKFSCLHGRLVLK